MTCKKKQEPKAAGRFINPANLGDPDAKPIAVGKLTKQFFMTLKAGYYLVSNVMISPLEPYFAETVGVDEEKIAQWQRITMHNVDNRKCYVFKNKGDHKNFFAPILERIAKKKIGKHHSG